MEHGAAIREQPVDICQGIRIKLTIPLVDYPPVDLRERRYGGSAEAQTFFQNSLDSLTIKSIFANLSHHLVDRLFLDLLLNLLSDALTLPLVLLGLLLLIPLEFLLPLTDSPSISGTIYGYEILFVFLESHPSFISSAEERSQSKLSFCDSSVRMRRDSLGSFGIT